MTGITRARENVLSQNGKMCSSCCEYILCEMYVWSDGDGWQPILFKEGWLLVDWSGTTTSLEFLYNFFLLTRLYSKEWVEWVDLINTYIYHHYSMLYCWERGRKKNKKWERKLSSILRSIPFLLGLLISLAGSCMVFGPW